MSKFRIVNSFAIKPKGIFVFAGEVLEGTVAPGMVFEVPEAGHRWRFVVRSVEMINTEGGNIVGLVIDDRTPGHLPGLGVGWTTELRSV